MATRRRFLLWLATGAGVITGSALVLRELAPPGGGVRFPEIRYGGEVCTQCRMIIGDVRFAAAWVENGQRELHFDDIGCMVAMARSASPPAGTSFYVHDYEHENWLDATPAAFVIAPAIATPMAYGVAAFASGESASDVARREGGDVYGWANLTHVLKGAQ